MKQHIRNGQKQLRVMLTLVFVMFLICCSFLDGLVVANSAVSTVSKFAIKGTYQVTAAPLRTERIIGDYTFFLGANNGAIAVLKNDAEHDFAGLQVLGGSLNTLCINPYDLRTYTKDSRIFLIVGCRQESVVVIYEFNPNSTTAPLVMKQRVSLGNGVSPVKLYVMENRGLLFAPCESSDSVQIIDLNPLTAQSGFKEAKVISFSGLSSGAKPCRVVKISDNVVLVFNAGNDTVATINVTNPASPNIIRYIPTGKNPYYGEGNGNVFIVDCQECNYLTILDTSNPLDTKLSQTLPVGDSPLIPKFVRNPATGKKDAVIVTLQGMNSGSNPNVQGFLVALDASNPSSVVMTDKILTRRGCGGVEVPDAGPTNVAVTENTPDGSLSWIDITDPLHPKLEYNTFLANNGEPHYLKFTPDGHHALVTDRINNSFVSYGDY